MGGCFSSAKIHQISIDKRKIDALARAVVTKNTDSVINILAPLTRVERFELLNSKDDHGRKPIYYAAEADNHELVTIMLRFVPQSHRLPIMTGTFLQDSAFLRAVELNKARSVISILDTLSEQQIINLVLMRYSHGKSILQLAVHNQEDSFIIPAILQKMHEDDRITLIELRDPFGKTVLHEACERGSLADFSKVMEYLTPHQARTLLFERNMTGLTPIHYAAYRGEVGIIDLILDRLSTEDKVAIICAQDYIRKKTPLHFAVQKKEIDAILHIIRAMPDDDAILKIINIRTNSGETVLDIARDAGCFEIVFNECKSFTTLIQDLPDLSTYRASSRLGESTPLPDERPIEIAGVVSPRREAPYMRPFEYRRSLIDEDEGERMVKLGSETHSEAEAAGGSKRKLQKPAGAPTLAAGAVAAEELAQAKAAAAAAGAVPYEDVIADPVSSSAAADMAYETTQVEPYEKERAEAEKSCVQDKMPRSVSPPSPEAAAGFIRDIVFAHDLPPGLEVLGSAEA